MTITRNGVALARPASRKAGGLAAYLALSPMPVGRSRLCELLWDVPNDPRGELRWSLSKIRGIVDEPGHRRLVTSDDRVALDLADCLVDVVEIANAMQGGIGNLPVERLQALSPLFAGD